MRASWSRRGGGLGLEAGLAPRPAGSAGGGGWARGSHGPGGLRAPRPGPASSAGGAGRRRGPLTSSVTRGCSFPRTWLQGTRCRWGSWPSSSRGRLCGSASPALAWNCSPTFAIFAARGPPPPAPLPPGLGAAPARPCPAPPPPPLRAARETCRARPEREGARGGEGWPARERTPRSGPQTPSRARAPQASARAGPEPGQAPKQVLPSKPEVPPRTALWRRAWPAARPSPRTSALTSSGASADSGPTARPPQQRPPSRVHEPRADPAPTGGRPQESQDPVVTHRGRLALTTPAWLGLGWA